jgi:hypothetical protein
MDNQARKYVAQKRAAFLLGIPEDELSQISSESKLGHTERAGDRKETFCQGLFEQQARRF